MKFLIVLLVAFVALACADVQILKSRSDVEPHKSSYEFETSDGTYAVQDGHLENEGSDHEAFSVKGSYSWVADDGVKYTINYVADENGFQPEGAHIPKA